ncbi:EamA family transporter RarD [Thaumasiovibrio subtropicus]|uniref:EamA family transporter RarD n=1 Tax=Thaumasiovibrio subtropicus TaxID=1891207 RepID=UPI000B356D97|nr:EamA family transporter RarD [Thaumasiovibrio subtropicus]
MNQQQQTRRGVVLAISAYTMWGIAPIYFKAIAHVDAAEILSHRVIWSFVLLGLLLTVMKAWPQVMQILRNPAQMKFLVASALLVGGNWLLFIWSVANNYMLEASLGYFINPILNVILGMVFLNERLRALQWAAVGLSFIGVAIQVATFGSLPWISLVLASSFGCYGLLRKKVSVGAHEGLFIETAVMLPLALGYLMMATSSTANLLANPLSLNLLLMAAGVVTTLPLLCFTGAATKLNLSTLGFFQYIGPSLMFILAVTLYDERLEPENVSTFGFIWLALALFTFDAVKHTRRQRKLRAA